MNEGADKFVAAAIQATPVWFDAEATIDKAVGLIDEAARNGARLLAFPETWVPGYPAHIFGAAAWDDPEAKEAYRLLLEESVTVPGPATDRLCEAARRNGVMVVMGVNERDGDSSRGTIYNSQVFISADGRVLGVHRKLWPTHAERLLWGQGDGSTLHVFDTPLGRVGGLICWEHWMPLARFAMHAKAEQVHIASWPEVPEIHHLASRHYAFEGRCFVICVGSYLTIDHVPAGFPCREAILRGGDYGEAGVICPGGSGIIAPDASWVAEPVEMREVIVYGEIDLARIGREQMALDSVGNYNRPDVFQLTVDARPKPAVRWLTPEGAGEADPAGQEGRPIGG
ncbi:MAG: carbon-nitrogen hydrolase family protein [Thermoleophilia bacterium]|nr:carbon-nitrogen hydrolase family protein [Thermoleophilia bacterium]